MKRILFVDDEPNVLDGLQDILRRQRREWTMVFALGADAALERLAHEPFDVVVSDMRMPGMDGAALLARVQRQYPHVARVVLSGHADREAVVRALPVAHQYLSKPCDAESLRGVIERTCHLQALLADDTIRALVSRLDRLPSVPRCYAELRQALADPDSVLADITAIVESDPAMSAKVLQLVNSAYFGLGQKVGSVSRAMTYLGLDLLRTVALTAQVFGAADDSPVAEPFCLEALRRHSLLTARLASRLAAGEAQSDEAFTTAIVHDIGKIILALGFHERYARIVALARAEGRPVAELEEEQLGVTHAEVGGYLLGVWGLPLSMVEAVTFHHRPSEMTSGSSDLLAALHVADALAHGAETEGQRPPGKDPFIDRIFLKGMPLAAAPSDWRAIAAREFDMLMEAR